MSTIKYKIDISGPVTFNCNGRTITLSGYKDGKRITGDKIELLSNYKAIGAVNCGTYTELTVTT